MPNRDQPNHLVDALSLQPSEVDRHIADMYRQLFHGNADTQSVYVESGPNEAYIYDVAFDRVPLDGMGYGMFVSVQLDHREEFDTLWRYTKRRFPLNAGSPWGPLSEVCPKEEGACSKTPSNYGVFYVAMALGFANSRWGSSSDSPYASEARAVLRALVPSVSVDSGRGDAGIDAGVNNLDDIFDVDTALVVNAADPMRVHPRTLAPGFFEYFGRLSEDWFWVRAADQARGFLPRLPYQATGLIPGAVDLSGSSIGSPIFRESSYAAGFNLALDAQWYGKEPSAVAVSDGIVGFFADRRTPYPGQYRCDTGAVDQAETSLALIALNGGASAIASVAEREKLLRAVWETKTPTGKFRFYDGLQLLIALLFLSGKTIAY